MKFGLIVVIALVVSAFATHFLLQDPGYVVINFRSYLIEMSVPILLAIIILIVIGSWLMVKVFRAPKKLGQAAGRYRSGRAGQRLTRGIIQLAEGNFAKGEKLLVSAAKVSEAPLMNYLAAARAAHLQGNDERRDSWLKQAYEELPEAGNAVLLTQAELQLDQAQFEQALATLRRIEENTPNHSHALALLGRLYFQLEDWSHLSELIPRLRKRGRVDSATLDHWAQRVYIEKLNNSGDGEAVIAEWKLIPKVLKKDLPLLEAYYESLMRTAMHDKAEKDLAAEIKKEWRGSLVRIFGMVEGADPTKQLRRAGELAKEPWK